MFDKVNKEESSLPPTKPWDPQPLVTFNEVCFSYKTIKREKKRVLHEIDFTINEGDYVALVGNNGGAGKSS
ncbi:hypothetical protein [Gracilibacillus sp. JCM 18860]|uniref:hypothetical protein n=1 Tax=Gracilibacillus sp. JCM 18860 TaxID=1306159 RepID=UPI000B287B23